MFKNIGKTTEAYSLAFRIEAVVTVYFIFYFPKIFHLPLICTKHV
jgi:hypothetical protein